MIIDKSWGQLDLKNASLLDDYAFHIYLEYMNKVFPDAKKRFFGQEFFKFSNHKEDYYSKANLILRKDKINKIKLRKLN